MCVPPRGNLPPSRPPAPHPLTSSLPTKKTHDNKQQDDQGRLFFSQDARLFSLADKRVLLDAYGAPAAAVARKLVSLRGSFAIYRGASFEPQDKVAEVKPAMLSLMPILKVGVRVCRVCECVGRRGVAVFAALCAVLCCVRHQPTNTNNDDKHTQKNRCI
jgi:hypothetical protein